MKRPRQTDGAEGRRARGANYSSEDRMYSDEKGFQEAIMVARR